jgi:hypothetical protein
MLGLKSLKSWFKTLQLLFVLDFVCLLLAIVGVGGDAMNGYIRDGKYFLGAHGQYIETTYVIYTISKIHIMTVFGLGILTLLSGLALKFFAKE